MRKKERKELEDAIDNLKASITSLRSQLVSTKVLQGYSEPFNWNLDKDLRPISLTDLKSEIDGIKNFLGIKFITEPSIPSKSYMIRQETTSERS